MDQVSFDTHAAARRLVRAGATDRLAEAVVETVAEATRTNMQILEDLAFLKHQGAGTASQSELQNTNTDLKILQTDLSSFKLYVEANMVTKKDLFRALWIQSMGMVTLFVALMGVVLWFVDFTLGKT